MRIPFRSEKVPSLAVASTGSQRVPATPGLVCAGPRDCGDCHACCIHLPIAAGEACPDEKPAGMLCPNLGDCGCLIYQTRPATCRQFRCVWLAEPAWPLSWRPEQAGLLCLREEIYDGVAAALVYEIHEDAITRPTTEPILASLQHSTAVVALVNLRQQRRLLHGSQWLEKGESAVRRPHFLQPIHTANSQKMREAS